MTNKAILIGRVGKDAETKGKATKFSVATSETWKDQQGQKQESTEWHNIVCFGKLAEICKEYVKKGMLIYVEGKIQTQKYEDKYYTSINAREVRFLSKPESGNSQQPTSFDTSSQDDDLPF